MLAVTLSAASLVAVILPDDQPTLSNRAPWLESYLGAVVVIGLLSMVVIQMAKDFSPIRRWFQRPWIKNWIKHRLPPGQVAKPRQVEVQKVWSVKDVEERLLLGAGEVRGRYLYNLPVEQLVRLWPARLDLVPGRRKRRGQRFGPAARRRNT